MSMLQAFTLRMSRLERRGFLMIFVYPRGKLMSSLGTLLARAGHDGLHSTCQIRLHGER